MKGQPSLSKVKSSLNEIVEHLGFVNDLRLKSKLFLVGKGSQTGLDEDGAKLLYSVKKFGSISMAARQVGKDYRRAWIKIDELEKSFGFRVVDRVSGGLGGGSAKLTLEGEVLLQKYLLAKKKAELLMDSDLLLKPDLRIMGSHCYALEILTEMIEERFKNFFTEYVNVGSQNGLRLVLENIADLSGVHLFDSESGEYNTFLLRNPSFGKKIALIRGYWRTQGIIVNKGNPKNILTLQDLFREDVVFVNRNIGSGTRALLDAMISKMASEKGLGFDNMVKEVRGYANEVRSHLEVAMAIKNGKADTGVGIRSVAKLFDLDFIPIQNERFDFVVLKDKVGSEKIGKFNEALSSQEFRSRVCGGDLGIEFDGEVGKILL